MTIARTYIAFETIVVKEIRRFLRIWPQTLLPSSMNIVLYILIFGNLIGSRIGEMGGFGYTTYIVPGLIMLAVLTNSYANVVSSFYGSKFQHNIEELLVAPVPNYVILIGYVLGGVARGLMVGLIVTCVSLLFTDMHIHNVLVTVTVIFLTAVLFALGGFVNAVYAHSFDDINIVPIFVLTPLTYLGGVFYSIDLLPEFWRTLSLGNPILYMVNAFRYGILGVSDIDITVAFGIIGLFIVVLFSYSMYLLRVGKGLRS